MIVLIEPISNNIGMYVPAYPLPLMEIGSYIKANEPDLSLRIISIPVDYGLPLTREGKKQVYRNLIKDLSDLKPKGIGISCTAISQAEETIHLCERIKAHDPSIFIFLGGYFPTIYPEEILERTSAVDLIVTGEGESTTLEIVRILKAGKNPKSDKIPNLAWKQNGHVHYTRKGNRFDLSQKALLNLELLKHPGSYDILPYAFSRGCPYQCNFCMEDYTRPRRQEVPREIILEDLNNLLRRSNARTMLIADALFKSFHLFPFLRSLGVKINFETRCDVLDPAIIPEIADVCGVLALGLESASYNTLKRMNKVRNRSHYKKYIANAEAIFREASRHNIPIMVFMIAGYPGDTIEDLEESLSFAKRLSRHGGAGGHVFKIGECHVYPKTKIYDLANSLTDVEFDNDGVFGQNIVRRPSRNLTFDAVLNYIHEIFILSNPAPKLQQTLLNVMPFFRLPAPAFQDNLIPDTCFIGAGRHTLNVRGESLSFFRQAVPRITKKYNNELSDQRSARRLSL